MNRIEEIDKIVDEITNADSLYEFAECVYEDRQQIAELEKQLANAIIPKLIVGHKYFAICSKKKEEVCPICNGNFRKTTIANGFRGELRCSNCDCGKIIKLKDCIIPFTLKYADYESNGNVSSNNGVEIDCKDCLYEYYSGGIYLDDNSDYRSSWEYRVDDQDKIFATKEEAQAKLEELKGESK